MQNHVNIQSGSHHEKDTGDGDCTTRDTWNDLSRLIRALEHDTNCDAREVKECSGTEEACCITSAGDI